MPSEAEKRTLTVDADSSSGRPATVDNAPLSAEALANSPPKTWLHTLVALGGAGLSTLFLLNLTFGMIEIPDNLPIVGNIDEVLASAVLFSCLSQLGINLVPFYKTLQAHRRGSLKL